LTGTLLGGDVEIDLRPAPATMPGYRIIATANGTATAEALVSELEVPLEDALQGATDFKARLLFARGQEENQQPFQIEVNSDLGGLTIGLPEPINKPAEEKICPGPAPARRGR
jgi:uncharacterized protein YhdP